MDLEALSAAGLYDAAAPGAVDRRDLLEFLVSCGCSLEEMVAAHQRGRLFALAGDRLVRPDRDRFTLTEVAARLQADPDAVRRLWRAFGLVAAADGPVASPDDVEMMQAAVRLAQLVGLDGALAVARVMGSSLARISDAAGGVARSAVPGMALELSAGEADAARTWAAVAAEIPALGRMLDVLFRHHVESARMHFERTIDFAGEQGGLRVAVGFADLCGFTSLSQQMPMAGLSQLMSRFEEVASDVVADHGGRLVKFIGDAVMYVCADAPAAVAIADGLVRAANVRGLQARAAVSSGVVLALDGDYFGPVVNLAARLVAVADAGTVLAAPEVAAAVAPAYRAEPLGPMLLRGFAEPVEVHRLTAQG